MRAVCRCLLLLASLPSMAQTVDISYTPTPSDQEIQEFLGSLATVTVRGWRKSIIWESRIDELRRSCADSDSPHCRGLEVGLERPRSMDIGIDLPESPDEGPEEMLLRGCTQVWDRELPPQGQCLTNKGRKPEYDLITIRIPGYKPVKVLNITLDSPHPYCGELDEVPGCRFTTIDHTCRTFAAGKCFEWHAEYSCPGGWVCPVPESPEECPDSGCPNFGRVGLGQNGALGTVVAALEAARQAGTYRGEGDDPAALRIFSGVRSECRDKISWGLGDCCRGGSQDQSTHNRAALASLGIGMAVRGVESVGSRHVRDLLFLNSDLEKGIRGLGAGLSGFTGTFSPAVSFYGVEVALTEGALTFGFDPASFAVAVAIAVIANLISCDAQEELLSLRRANGLCVHTASWCSKRRFFSCKEEREAHCCYNSRLAKAIAQAAKSQLGQSATHCGGFTVEQIERIDFASIDLAPVLSEMSGHQPNVDGLLSKYLSENAAVAATMTVAPVEE